MTKEVLKHEADQVVTLTLNRPERLNALNDTLLNELLSLIGDVDERHRAVVLRGAGRAFSSGHDLKAAAARGDGEVTPESARQAAEAMQSITRAIRACPAPVVAVVHGYAIGGAAEIAFSSDLAIASFDTSFQFTETAVGLVVTNGMTTTLPRTVGPLRAKELVLLGEPFDAETAQRLGLVNRVVPETQLDDALETLLGVLRQRSPLALRIAKRLLDVGVDGHIEGSLSAEVEATVEAEMSEDAREASRAFVEKRHPHFTVS